MLSARNVMGLLAVATFKKSKTGRGETPTAGPLITLH